MKKMREMRKFCCFSMAVIMSAVLFSLTVSAQYSAQPFLSGLSAPIFITNAGDGSNRLFVVERGGVIKVFQPGATVATTPAFLDITPKIGTGGERGLLGLAFHPDYKNNRRFFVYYANTSGDIQISEFQTSAGNANFADAATEKSIITIPHPTNTNHYGGTLAFGADGFLYAGTGDGGSGDDPPNNAQNKNVLLGKFIRLNVNPPAGSGVPYTIPADNPFVNTANTRGEIYALGVRNPYRWSFDRGGTHQLWAGDVGQNVNEEVDIITNGGNFGWRILEGFQCNPNTNINPGGTCTAPPAYVPPLFQYNHSVQNDSTAVRRCSIIGGYIYRGARGTLPNGAYVYGDYCTGEVLMYSGGQQSFLFDGANQNLVSFGEAENGELFIVGQGGTIDKLVSSLAPTAAAIAISGRVITATGRGIRNVTIKLTDADGNVRTAATGAFGYYRFEDVAAGGTYVLRARGKRFTFSQPLQVVSANEDLNEVDFVANP